MKILSRMLLILGAIALAAAIGVCFYGGFEVWRQYIALSANRSQPFSNPLGMMLGGAGLALVAGFLAGLGIGIPKGKKEAAKDPVNPTSPGSTTAPGTASPDLR